MPKYSFVVKDSVGKTYSGNETASDQESLVGRLQKQGYFIISIKPFTDAQIKKAAAKQIHRNLLVLDEIIP